MIIEVHCDLYIHPLMRAAGVSCIPLYLEGAFHCCRENTDRMTHERAMILADRHRDPHDSEFTELCRLLDVGLWVDEGDGYIVVPDHGLFRPEADA